MNRSFIRRWRSFATLAILAASLLAPVACGFDNSEAKLDRFEKDIRKFEVKDDAEAAREKVKVPHHLTVFVGSSTFTRWQALETIFRSEDAIDRGFGGATIPEIIHFADRIVCKYHPLEVVFYAGTNDIGELHHTGEQVADDYKLFVAKVREQCPDADIFFVSMSVPPSRLQFIREYNVGNDLIRKFTDTDRHLHYIDVTPVMHDEQGRLKLEYFDPKDHLHMTPAGYAAWIPIIQKAIDLNRLAP